MRSNVCCSPKRGGTEGLDDPEGDGSGMEAVSRPTRCHASSLGRAGFSPACGGPRPVRHAQGLWHPNGAALPHFSACTHVSQKGTARVTEGPSRSVSAA